MEPINLEHTALNHSLGIKTTVSTEQQDFLEEADGVNPKLLIVQDDMMTQYVNRGSLDTRNWNWIMLSIRFPFEIVFILSPMN